MEVPVLSLGLPSSLCWASCHMSRDCPYQRLQQLVRCLLFVLFHNLMKLSYFGVKCTIVANHNVPDQLLFTSSSSTSSASHII